MESFRFWNICKKGWLKEILFVIWLTGSSLCFEHPFEVCSRIPIGASTLYMPFTLHSINENKTVFMTNITLLFLFCMDFILSPLSSYRFIWKWPFLVCFDIMKRASFFLFWQTACVKEGLEYVHVSVVFGMFITVLWPFVVSSIVRVSCLVLKFKGVTRGKGWTWLS